MSDQVNKAYQATPDITLEQQIMDPNFPKNEREWWAAERIAQLEAALRAVMDDLTLIGENNWLPVGLLDDVIYVNALAALEERT